MENSNKEQEQKEQKEQKEQEPNVNENSGILIDEHIKIFDPNTNETLVNKRG